MDADDPPILLPCAVCGRTFSPDSLERHTEICAKNRSKKRKPFDSAKQRLQGTELAEFNPKQETRRQHDEKSLNKTSWKKKHDDLLRTIREARGEMIDSRKKNESLILSGAPTRANEKGTCPTCNRHFGIRAYDRHVAWCKDRITQVSVNPAVNLAKERLEARIRYRAPTLKSRRTVTREKYSPGSTANQSTKSSLSAPSLAKPKENTLITNYSRETSIKQKPAVVKRPGQHKESPISPRPMKSRIIDRANRPTEDHDSAPLSTSSYLTVSSRRPAHFPIPLINVKNNDTVSSNEIGLSTASSKKQSNRDKTTLHCVQNDETKNRETYYVRTQKNIVTARSQGLPKLNNVSVNDEALGVTIQPCTIHKDTQYTQKDDHLVTWKQISHKKDSFQNNDSVVNSDRRYPSQGFYQIDRVENISKIESLDRTEKDLSTTKNNFSRNRIGKDSLEKKTSTRFNDDINKIDKGNDAVAWLDDIQNLNQTYLIKDSEDIEQPNIFHSKWKPIKHSPRVEFYFKDIRENETDKKKLEGENVINNKKIKISGRKAKSLRINNENKENETKTYVKEELIIDKEIGKDNKQGSSEEIEMTEYKVEDVNLKNENKRENCKANNENIKIAECDVKEVEANTEDKQDFQIIDNENTAISEKLDVNGEDKKDELITIDKEIIETVDYIEMREMKQNLSDFDQCIEIPISDVINTQGVSNEFEQFYSEGLQTNSIGDNDHLLSDKNSEMLAEQNSAIVVDDYLNENMNDIFLQVEVNRQYQEKFFDNSNKFENIGDNIKDEKTDFNEHSENNKNELFDYSISKAEGMADEGLFTKNVNDFDYDNNDTVCVEEYNMQGVNDSESSIMLKNKSRYCHEQASSNTSISLPRHVHDLAKRVIKEQVNLTEMKHKIRKNMNLLRGSTDSLVSSIEFVELASIKRPETNSTYERETIEIIRPSRQNRMFRHFPDIRSELVETRENSERSYWKKATKISHDRLIGFDSSCHEEYKAITKRNPRVCVLPPVVNSSLTNHRTIELTTRPAWCSYVRRRPDFNLVLKARTGTYENYDPFLLAEQQLKDLLSDTNDQCMTRSSPSKLQQTRDTLYPLSHSSAFVKYPSSDRRASLIAPPSEFDDLISDFSSDSTETNSIIREVFLKSDALADNKNVTNSTSPKSGRELGRRVIIDKSKALGVDERRGNNSTDKLCKVDDNVMPKITKSLIGQTNSIRASSANVSSSNRKTLSDIKKTRGSRIVEGQRSSDQRLNQRNNSSLSGSNLSLSSIVSSSELDVKRSNSMFDELMTSFEEDVFPNLRSFRNNESFDLFSPGGDRQRNLISDEELSSPDSYKPQDHNKLSNDSAYSSLNRKYSRHGRSTNDMTSRFDEDMARNGISPIQTTNKSKMSKFCHECGQRFPEVAKFCCECGVRRLAL